MRGTQLFCASESETKLLVLLYLEFFFLHSAICTWRKDPSHFLPTYASLRWLDDGVAILLS